MWTEQVYLVANMTGAGVTGSGGRVMYDVTGGVPQNFTVIDSGSGNKDTDVFCVEAPAGAGNEDLSIFRLLPHAT